MTKNKQAPRPAPAPAPKYVSMSISIYYIYNIEHRYTQMVPSPAVWFASTRGAILPLLLLRLPGQRLCPRRWSPRLVSYLSLLKLRGRGMANRTQHVSRKGVEIALQQRGLEPAQGQLARVGAVDAAHDATQLARVQG